MVDVAPLRATRVFGRVKLIGLVGAIACAVAALTVSNFLVYRIGFGYTCLLVAALGCAFIYLWLAGVPLRVFCQHEQCGKYIPRDTHWRCGFCDFKNEDKHRPFYARCEQCNRVPKAYVCHHCEAPIFFDLDKDASHAARKWVPQEQKKPSESFDATRQTHAQERAMLSHAVDIARLDVQLAAERAKLQPPQKPKMQSERERLEADLKETLTSALGADELADRALAEVSEDIKRDPEKFERYKEVVEIWRERNSK